MKSKLTSYLTRFLLLVLLTTLITAFVMVVVSDRLSESLQYSTTRNEMLSAVHIADDALSALQAGSITQDELDQIVNPVMNPSGMFLLLLTPDQARTALTKDADVHFPPDSVSDWLSQLDMGVSLLVAENTPGELVTILGTKTENGYIFAGRSTLIYSRAAYSFRSGLLAWTLPLLLLIALIFMLTMHRVSVPVTRITDVADKLVAGESVIIDDNMPGELGTVARAFNAMSDTISRNMHELSNEKETLRLILEGLNEGIVALDGSGNVIHENKASHNLLGGPESDTYKQLLSRMQGALNEKNTITDKLKRGDSMLLFVITPLPGDSNTGVLALIRDITEEERLIQTRYDYVANISHELRTPLANMRGLVEGLKDGLVTDENDQKRYLGIILDEVKRLSRLVNDLLELSGLQSNPAAFEVERIEPNEVLWELFDLNKRLFSDKRQALLLSVPQNDLPTVVTNEDRLSEVLTIFLDNARKYTPEGGEIVLGAQIEGDEAHPSGVRFFVRDNGIGMDEETQRHVFDRFHQAEKSHANKGSGLGLAIAREILLKMGVNIALKSEPSKGSEFSFILSLNDIINTEEKS